MKLLRYGFLGGALLLFWAGMTLAQQQPLPAPASGGLSSGGAPATISRPVMGPYLDHCLTEIADLQQQQVALQVPGKDDPQAKKLENLQKQIEVLQKMVDLLVGQMKNQPGPAAMTRLETQAAQLEARSVQAARRDQELASALDDVKEHIDAQERYGPSLPSQLKELFLASGTNETPLSIYGALTFGYSKIGGDATTAANGAGRPATPGGFYFGEFTPDFFLKLNDWILLSAEISVNPNGAVSGGSFLEADFFLADWLTISGGRFVAPIGFYNIGLNNPWVNKLPADVPGAGPLLWQQVLPAFSLLGVRAQGSFYLGGSPFKLEYQAYYANGLNLTPATAGAPTVDELANLENMENTFAFVTNSKASGGRIALWWPEKGVEAGISGMYNGQYLAGNLPDSINLWAVDFHFHKGDWDVQIEYGMLNQQAGNFLGSSLRREGFYTQLAYRPNDGPRFVRDIELIYRYSYVDFPGINANQLNLAAYATPIDVPVRRQQHEFGIDYWLARRLVLKVAYQINDEPKFHLHDNQFIAELAWGW
jgi:hypothetical protein